MHTLLKWKPLLLAMMTGLVLGGCGDSDRDETVPTLQIVSVLTPEGGPALEAPVKAEQVEIAADVEAGSPLQVSSDRLLQTEIPSTPDPAEPTRWHATVPISLGNNILTVTASDGAGNLHIVRLLVVRTEGPLLLQSVPAAGAEGVPLGATIDLTFDEEVAAPGSDSFQLRPVGGELLPLEVGSFDSVNRTVVVRPSTLLTPATLYQVVVSPVAAPLHDLEGNPMVERSWTFTTGE